MAESSVSAMLGFILWPLLVSLVSYLLPFVFFEWVMISLTSWSSHVPETHSWPTFTAIFFCLAYSLPSLGLTSSEKLYLAPKCELNPSCAPHTTMYLPSRNLTPYFIPNYSLLHENMSFMKTIIDIFCVVSIGRPQWLFVQWIHKSLLFKTYSVVSFTSMNW